MMFIDSRSAPRRYSTASVTHLTPPGEQRSMTTRQTMMLLVFENSGSASHAQDWLIENGPSTAQYLSPSSSQSLSHQFTMFSTADSSKRSHRLSRGCQPLSPLEPTGKSRIVTIPATTMITLFSPHSSYLLDMVITNPRFSTYNKRSNHQQSVASFYPIYKDAVVSEQ